MKACGLVVEYNPLHNGHLYHIQSARKVSNTNCIIAIMSGSFLQRGEPAIIDKFHRTKSALAAGVDIVLELPYAFSVQNSDSFAYGAIKSLYEIGVDSICFGSESGDITHFITSYDMFKEKKPLYEQILIKKLNEGISFPRASEYAFEKIGLTTKLNLAKPNNILGFSYVKTILSENMDIQPLTIKRVESDFHDDYIKGSIASATSLRNQIHSHGRITEDTSKAMPNSSIAQLNNYKNKAGVWHRWEAYFPLLQYRVLTMPADDLSMIHDVDEGLENRIIATAKRATSFNNWMKLLKTKRYTWTRLQRVFTHILTNTTKHEIELATQDELPYLRMLGFSKRGQAYLNQVKKDLNVPLITNILRNPAKLLFLEEKASYAYYSVLPPKNKQRFQRQELQQPIFYSP